MKNSEYLNKWGVREQKYPLNYLLKGQVPGNTISICVLANIAFSNTLKALALLLPKQLE